MATCLSRTKPKARIQHHCDSCGGPIEAGTVYNRSFYTDGGDAWTWKAHPACTKAGNILWDNGIRGDEDCLINVSDMDREDREMVYRTCPETYHAVWPNAPAPGQPALAVETPN